MTRDKMTVAEFLIGVGDSAEADATERTLADAAADAAALDPWRRAPLSAEQLAKEREDALAAGREHVPHLVEAIESGKMQWTCDGCPRAPVCVLAYDFYNTDGDCLDEK